jgi:hypothetical protein
MALRAIMILCKHVSSVLQYGCPQLEYYFMILVSMQKCRKLLSKYIGCEILVSAKVGKRSLDWNKYCITNVKYGNSTVTDHLRIRWVTFKGKWEVVYLYITIHEYTRKDWTKDFWVKNYKYIPVSVAFWRYENTKKKRKKW